MDAEKAQKRADKQISGMMTLGLMLQSVSYTHLDVYKRQGQGESTPKARPKGVVDGKQVNLPVLGVTAKGLSLIHIYEAGFYH